MAKNDMSPPKASSTGKTVDATTPQRQVSPNYLEKLAESIESNKKMLAELMRAQREAQAREEACVPKRRRRWNRLESESPEAKGESLKLDDTEAQTNARMQGISANVEVVKLTNLQRQVSSGSYVEVDPAAEDLFSPMMLPRIEKKGSEDGDSWDRINRESDEDEESSLDQECEIISTEQTTRLSSVPKTAARVKNAAELRRLLEDINLYHLPR